METDSINHVQSSLRSHPLWVTMYIIPALDEEYVDLVLFIDLHFRFTTVF